jgi:hypothetical protein
MKTDEQIFTKTKWATIRTISGSLFNYERKLGQKNDDFIRDQWTIMTSMQIYKKQSEPIFIEQPVPPPTFLDWLFKRTKVVTVKVTADDLLLLPTQSEQPPTFRIFNAKGVEQKQEE